MATRSPDSFDSAIQPFSVSAQALDSGALLIEISGEFDLAVAERFDEAIEGVAPESKLVLVSLRECEFIDSTAIARLIFAHREFEREGVRLILCEPVDQVRHVLSITGLLTHDFVCDSVEEALSGATD